MKNAKLYQLLAMVVASSTLGARGLACMGPPCDPWDEHFFVPIVPVDAGEDGGSDSPTSTEELCQMHCQGADSCKLTTIAQADGTMVPALECNRFHQCDGIGRRPAGWTSGQTTALTSQAQWIVYAAQLEAASVDAFRCVRRDLRAHGAPRSLLRQASRAVREEKRHTRRMRALAKRTGLTQRPLTVDASPIPSLEEMARQNAVEGCVREAFGALVAQFQALHAQDREFAATMKRIAVDEAHHAALAYRIDAWARKRLDPNARQRVELARRAAAYELVQDVTMVGNTAGRAQLGLPDPCARAALARAMVQVLRIDLDEPSTS